MEPWISRADVLAALGKYLQGDGNGDRLTEWADEMENPEKVAYEDAHSNLIASVLFDLATPEINGEPTPEKVGRWVQELAAEA